MSNDCFLIVLPSHAYAARWGLSSSARLSYERVASLNFREILRSSACNPGTAAMNLPDPKARNSPIGSVHRGRLRMQRISENSYETTITT